MQIGQICTRSLVTCRREASVPEVARLMRDRHVGNILVVEERAGRITPVGIVTDRDLVVRVLAAGADATTLRAADVMCAPLETALDSELVYDAIWHMRKKQILRLPVVDAHDSLVGMLTADDVTEFLSSELSEVARLRAARHATPEPPGDGDGAGGSATRRR